ncbi:MAG: S49 family peptidase, partial [Calditrichaeota bacterium]|nr:S49 family peptidase [Calditrichota bacterium]
MPRFNTKISIFALLFALPLHAQVAPDFLQLPHYSVANVDNAMSLVINPAGLGIKNGQSIFVLAPFKEKTVAGDFGFAYGGQLTGFSSEFIRNGISGNRNKYTTGFGLGWKWLYMGAAYAWTSGLDRQNNWDVGAIARPLRFISLGAVARGINQPRVFDQHLNQNMLSSVGWDLGIAFRPFAILNRINAGFGNRITLNADVKLRKYDYTLRNTRTRIIYNLPSIVFETDNYQENVEWRFGADVEIIPGITGSVDYSPEVKEGVHQQDEQLFAGLTMNFGVIQTGARQSNPDRSGVAWVGVTELYHPTMLKERHERFVEIKLRGSIIEYQDERVWWRPRQRTVYELIRKIEAYGEDPDVAGIIIRLENFSAGWAKLQEIRDALLEFEYTGKSVVAYLENCGNGGYYIASVADQIFMNPVGSLNLTGLVAHSMYLRGTLDCIGINAQYATTGRYKTATDQ